jgi:hypothetical protein
MSRSLAGAASEKKAEAAAASRGEGVMADVQRAGELSAMRATLRLRNMDRGTAGTLSQVHIAGNGRRRCCWWWWCR